jgi:hypothetical protein
MKQTAELPAEESRAESAVTDEVPVVSAVGGADADIKPKGISRTPHWPDYFARLGQPDSANWQYQGYWKDTFTVWRAYYTLVIGHPIVTFHGMRHFFQSLIYRISNEHAGQIAYPIIAVLTPIMMVFTPFISLLAVATAPPYLQHVRKMEMPPLFRPFSFMGWANYNVMLVTMFTMHSYRQYQKGWHPSRALQHSSKIFWHDFFEEHLPEGHRATVEYAIIADGHIRGEIPKDDIVIKPTAGGAGVFLRTMTWDDEHGVYRCHDPEQPPNEKRSYTPEELKAWIEGFYEGGVIEKLERTREPFPVSSFRIMTLNITGEAELICAVFLPAPEGSNSTAYFDLDTYLMNYEDSTIGQPIRVNSDGKYTGIPVPEMDGIIEACISLHNKLPAHVEVSWDVIATADGPVYLEGNIFPPGCDYKLSIFKKYSNFLWLKNRLLSAPA